MSGFSTRGDRRREKSTHNGVELLPCSWQVDCCIESIIPCTILHELPHCIGWQYFHENNQQSLELFHARVRSIVHPMIITQRDHLIHLPVYNTNLHVLPHCIRWQYFLNKMNNILIYSVHPALYIQLSIPWLNKSSNKLSHSTWMLTVLHEKGYIYTKNAKTGSSLLLAWSLIQSCRWFVLPMSCQ